MLKNISIILITVGCNQPDSVIDETVDAIQEPPQLTFVRALRAKGLVESSINTNLVQKLYDLSSHTQYKDRITINGELDSSKLNFYIVNAEKDSTLANMCAYIGLNTILLDKQFLMHFLDKDSFFCRLPVQERDAMYSSFQSWVIGHEIAHVVLRHETSHFISYRKPKDSREGFQFHQNEIAADEKSIEYTKEHYPALREIMFLRIFQVSHDSIYGPEPNSPNRYLRYYDEFGLQRPYVFRGIGSHPLMIYRSALLLLLTSQNEVIKNEAYIFLIQINAFGEVRKWQPSDKKNK